PRRVPGSVRRSKWSSAPRTSGCPRTQFARDSGRARVRTRGRFVLRRVHDGQMRVLARVQSEVRALQQLFRLAAVPRENGNANARLQLQRHAVEVERLVERATNTLGDEEGARAVLCALQHECELVAA